MKNSLLATAVASTLLLASSAHAFTGKIEFTGKLVDKNPYWSISIPAKSIQDAKGWKSKLTDGKAIKGDKTEFSFKKDIPFVEGHMTKILNKKNANGALITTGIDPIVTIAGYKLGWTENNEVGGKPQELSVKIRGQAHGSDVKDGELKFTLNDGFATTLHDISGKSIWMNAHSKYQQKARSLNKNIFDQVAQKYPSLPISNNGNSSYNSRPGQFSNNPNYDSYVGAFVTELSGFKATFDNDAIPEKWTASIPVTISYQ